MRTIMVRYKTSEAHADDNARLVHSVFEELRARAPAGFEYATYRLADGVTFVHVATVASMDEHPLRTSPAFKAFRAELESRCVEPPVTTELVRLEAYGSLQREPSAGASA
jgi:hypothetical protein